MDALLSASDEFARLWERHEVGLRWSETKRFVHPQVGQLDLYCQLLLEPDQGQSLLVFTATPGTESTEPSAAGGGGRLVNASERHFSASFGPYL
nr:hypothetical protein [Streptomyces sp. NEAU-383]